MLYVRISADCFYFSELKSSFTLILGSREREKRGLGHLACQVNSKSRFRVYKLTMSKFRLQYIHRNDKVHQ